MRGLEDRNDALFLYVSPESFVPADHPLRPIRKMADKATPHVAQNDTNRSPAIDGRTTRHPGYEVSGKIRKRIEEIFGWIKTIGTLRKASYRGTKKLSWYFTLAVAAYDLVRMRNLRAGAA